MYNWKKKEIIHLYITSIKHLRSLFNENQILKGKIEEFYRLRVIKEIQTDSTFPDF